MDTPFGTLILVVEDELKTRQSIVEALKMEGWTVAAAATGDEALGLVAAKPFDLMVVDWMLPGGDGLKLVEKMRLAHPPPRVLMLTARASLDDRVTALDAGADDYLAKPFALAELTARCRALFRRHASPGPFALACGDLRLDTRARVATRGGREISLSPRELDLLEYLLRHQDRIVSREMLERDVWKQPRRFTSLDNVIEVQMLRLRRKIDGAQDAKLIHTLRGRGYLLGTDTA